MTDVLPVKNGNGALVNLAVVSDSSSNVVPLHQISTGGEGQPATPVGPDNPFQTQDQGLPKTPVAGTAFEIVTGGTAIIAVTGPIKGGYITNPANAAAQGIVTAENAYLDMVGTPGSTDAAANGTTSLLSPGQGFDLPPLATGVAVKLNAATTGHKFTVVVW